MQKSAVDKQKAAKAGAPRLLYCLLALSLFMCLKLAEIYVDDRLSVWELIVLESLQYGFLMLFAIFWYDAAIDRRRAQSLASNKMRKSRSNANLVRPPAPASHFNPAEVRETQKTVPAITQDLIQSMKPLLESLLSMDRSRGKMPQSNQQPDPLSSLSCQSQRISQIIKQLESRLHPQSAGNAPAAQEGGHQWVRQAPRFISVNPLTVRGQDFQRNWFETLSYTLNASPYGACLILPEQPLQIGQTLSIYDQHLGTQASVCWLANGRKGGMVVAGVKFSKPLPSLIPLPAAVPRSQHLAGK
jgi:hypothetical protein